MLETDDSTGEGFMVISKSSEAAAHGPAGSFVVNVNKALPFAISVADGIYTAFKVVAFGTNMPEPPDQVPVTADPPIAPSRFTSSPSQMI